MFFNLLRSLAPRNRSPTSFVPATHARTPTQTRLPTSSFNLDISPAAHQRPLASARQPSAHGPTCTCHFTRGRPTHPSSPAITATACGEAPVAWRRDERTTQVAQAATYPVILQRRRRRRRGARPRSKEAPTSLTPISAAGTTTAGGRRPWRPTRRRPTGPPGREPRRPDAAQTVTPEAQGPGVITTRPPPSSSSQRIPPPQQPR